MGTLAAAPTRSVELVQRLLLGLSALGVPADAIRARLQVPPGPWPPRAGRVPVRVVNQLWDAALAISGDESIGMRLGTLMRADHYEVLGYIWKTSPTLGSAMIRLSRYGRLLADGLDAALDVAGDRATIRLPRLPPAFEHRQAAECSVSALGTIASELAGEKLRALEVHFVHREPADTRPHGARFGLLPRFGCAANALVIDANLLHLPIRTHDAALCRQLEQRAEALIASLPDASSLVARLQQVIAEELPHGNASADRIAARLGMHRRTLARHLARDDTSYRDVLDTVRAQLAQSYLQQTELPVDQIAFALGFADGSAFVRAFKRWTQRTPSAYRGAHR